MGTAHDRDVVAKVPRAGSARSGAGPRRDGVVGLDPQRLGSESILGLQRAVGNRVVGQLLGPQQIVTAAPVVQRVPYGLDKQPSQDKYVNQAVKLWQTRPQLALVDFAEAMMQTIAAELKAAGVPFFGWTFGSSTGASGMFDSKAWKVRVNVAKFSGRGTPKVLKDLTPDEVADVIGTLYHESRHTDQDVLIIRTMLDQKKTVGQIFSATGIRKDVIKAISTTTFADPLDADQIAHAGRMFDVMYGAHKELLEFLMLHSAAFDGLTALAEPASKLSAAATHLKTFGSWQTAVLQPKLKQLGKLSKPTPVETALLQRLQTIDTTVTALRAGWTKTTGAKKKPSQAESDSVRQLASDAKDAVADAYVNLEGEKDAFRVEGEIASAFSQQVPTP